MFKFSGFASQEGSLGEIRPADAHVAIVTYWRLFEDHERSHADKAFRDKCSVLAYVGPVRAHAQAPIERRFNS